mmetsp:Transcript_7267/g.8421  ORF Transcript_7267/g.8421 Transcript_7267/m.8421 type:complete len:130 (-) Transcript_7267:106-495(-)
MQNYVEDNQDRESLKVLDIGTGNGAMLLKLTKRGIYREAANVTLKGMDYSEQSVAFCNQIKQTYSEKEGISEELKADYAKITFEVQDAFNLIEGGEYDIINDKGTFDVVFLNRELSNSDYVRAIHHRIS